MQIKFLYQKTLQVLSLGMIITMLAGCSSQGGTKKTDEVTVDQSEIDTKAVKDLSQVKNIFYSLPSPLETAMLIKTAGAKYNEDLLNPIRNVDNYNTSKSMALNLGIYTTDLSFASLFDQTQTAIKYMGNAKKLADKMGILDAIDNNTIARLEENVNNRDVIMDIISETFMSSSAYLSDANRKGQAAIVLVGGWVEGLYIATQLVGNNSIKDNKLVQRIVDQKYSLDIVMHLLDSDEVKDNPDVATVKNEMVELKKIFDKITIKTSKIEPVYDKNTKVTTLKSKSEIEITADVFKELTNKVKATRSNFIL
jgi:hypothetical protein